MRIRFRTRRTLASLLLAVAAAACYDAATQPASPDLSSTVRPAATAQRSSQDSRSGGNHQVAQCDPRPALQVTQTVGPAGGTLVIGQSRLIVPAGALSVAVPIRASTPGGTTSEVDFKPHGLKFAKAITLILDSNGCQVGENLPPRILYLGPNGSVQEIIPATRDAQDNVIAQITHFSGYAIAF